MKKMDGEDYIRRILEGAARASQPKAQEQNITVGGSQTNKDAPENIKNATNGS